MRSYAGERALLRAARHAAAARWRKLRPSASSHKILVLTLFAAALASLSAVSSFAISPTAHTVSSWLLDNEILVGLASSVYALLFVLRRRAHFTSEHAQSWLRATMSASAFRAMAIVRACTVLAALVLLVVAGMAALIIANRLALAGVGDVAVSLLIGCAVGGAIGGAWPLRSRADRSADSRFVRDVRARPTVPSLQGLSRWPIAKAIAWHRPENSRMLFIIAALSVPMGASAILGLAILAMWSLGSYLIALARAVPAVAHEASIWLRPTALPFVSFAWAIARRAFIHQFVGTTLLAAVAMMLGGRLGSVAYLASLWLSLTVMIAMIGLRQHYWSLPASGRTWLSVALVVLAESRGRGWGLPLAAGLTLAHARGASRERA
jgi:hypothetical protein